MSDKNRRVCPVETAGPLDSRIRRYFQNPRKILAPYLKEGMCVLDMGCGPGFFSIEMARMVGGSGRIIASDLQEGMLGKVRGKIRGTELEERITPHKCEEDRIGISEMFDFVLAFYVLHEVPDQESFFKEIASILKADGRIFIAEPPIHVSKSAFEETLGTARNAGFVIAERPKMFLSKTALLEKGRQ